MSIIRLVVDNDRYPPDEKTDQGTQRVLPGGARSARQAQAARDAFGRGKLRSWKPQRDPGGLFEPKAPRQPDLFGGST